MATDVVPSEDGYDQEWSWVKWELEWKFINFKDTDLVTGPSWGMAAGVVPSEDGYDQEWSCVKWKLMKIYMCPILKGGIQNPTINEISV